MGPERAPSGLLAGDELNEALRAAGAADAEANLGKSFGDVRAFQHLADFPVHPIDRLGRRAGRCDDDEPGVDDHAGHGFGDGRYLGPVREALAAEPSQRPDLAGLDHRSRCRERAHRGLDAAAAVGRYEERMHVLIDALASAFRPDAVNLFALHGYVVGGLAGGGERDAHVANEYGINAVHLPRAVEEVQTQEESTLFEIIREIPAAARPHEIETLELRIGGQAAELRSNALTVGTELQRWTEEARAA